MHYSKYIIVLLTLIGLTICTVVSAQTTDIRASPDRLTISQGQVFDVLLHVTPSTTIDTVAINISMWDPRIAEVTKITIGGINNSSLFSDQTVWIGGKEINNDLGYIKQDRKSVV